MQLEVTSHTNLLHHSGRDVKAFHIPVFSDSDTATAAAVFASLGCQQIETCNSAAARSSHKVILKEFLVLNLNKIIPDNPTSHKVSGAFCVEEPYFGFKTLRRKQGRAIATVSKLREIGRPMITAHLGSTQPDMFQQSYVYTTCYGCHVYIS